MSFWQRIFDIDRRLDSTSYYELLGVKPDARGEDILDRYYHLAGHLHPDRHARASREERQALSRVHARLTEARRVLSSPAKRAEYDRLLASGEHRLDDTTKAERRQPAAPDPANAVARGFYDEGKRLASSGDREGARKRLELALHYEPGSAAIAAALAGLDADDEKAESEAAEDGDSALDDFLGGGLTIPGSQLPGFGADADEPEPEPEPEPEEPPTPVPSRRAHPRHEMALPVRLRIPTWERLRLLYTRDVSRGGMFVETDTPLEVGAVLDLSLVAPSGDVIDLRAEVVRAVRPGERQRPGMGLRFIDLDDATLASIAELAGAAEPRAASGAASSERSETSLEELVAELLRLRRLSPAEVLGIPEGADSRRAGEAYAELARRYHPVRNGADDPVRVEVCRELMECVRRAYESFGR